MPRNLNSLVFITTFLSSSPVFADTGLYLTAGIGDGFIEDTDINADYDLTYGGHFTSKVGLGYQIVEGFAFEADFQYFFNQDSNADDIDLRVKSDGYTLSLLGVMRIPFQNNNFQLVLKLGPSYTSLTRQLNVAYEQYDFYNGTFNYFQQEETFTSDGPSISYAAGIEYDFTPQLGLNVEYLGTTVFVNTAGESGGLEVNTTNREQINSFMANLIWRF